jgi:hypothetical protein
MSLLLGGIAVGCVLGIVQGAREREQSARIQLRDGMLVCDVPSPRGTARACVPAPDVVGAAWTSYGDEDGSYLVVYASPDDRSVRLMSSSGFHGADMEFAEAVLRERFGDPLAAAHAAAIINDYLRGEPDAGDGP